MPVSVPSAGLTTSEAPAIEDARLHGRLFIQQPYNQYSEENHQTWHTLYERMRPRWTRYANSAFLRGMHSLQLNEGRIPRLEDVNQFLSPLTGFQARAVSGYVPSSVFFDCLRNRQFPTTVTIRRPDRLDYLPEPDIFHDIAGHVPMHTDKAFAETLVRFGECARTAADVVRDIQNPAERTHALSSIIRGMARFFWFTVEFGLMRSNGETKAYGSGLLSSFGELEHAIESPDVQRFRLQLESAINQPFEIDHYQPLLFTVQSFDELYEFAGQLDQWVRAGKLNHVAPGEPSVNEDDLKSYLQC